MIAKRVEDELPGGGGLAPSDCGPTVLRILLGCQLRRLRRAGEVPPETAGRVIGASPARIGRIEQGRAGLGSHELAVLLDLYGVQDADERAALLMLSGEVSIRGWWHRQGEAMSGWSEVHVGLEEAASVIRSYEMQFVPALLQTEEYARVVTRLMHATAGRSEIDRRVGLLMRRQRNLLPGTPRLRAVVEETALRRVYGDSKVMRAQLDHLREMVRLSHITLSVVPMNTREAHPNVGGPFSILSFAGPELPDVVYLEQITGALYFDKYEDTHHYMEVMDRLSLQAPPPSATPEFLARLRDEIC